MKTIEVIGKKVSGKYWSDQLKDIFARPFHEGDRISTEKLMLDKSELVDFNHLTNNDALSRKTVVLTLYGLLLYRYFGYFDGLVVSFDLYGNEYGCNITPLLFQTQMSPSNSIKKGLGVVRKEIKQVYKYRDYDLESLKRRLGGKNLESFADFANPIVNQFLLQF